MKYALIAILSFALFSDNYIENYTSESFLSSSFSNKTLNVKDYDDELLNATFFHLLNAKRKEKGLNEITYDASLKRAADYYQTKLEFKSFQYPENIIQKIDKDLFQKTKAFGFEGTLVLPFAKQHIAVDYNGSEFFFNKYDKETDLHLFYGKKPRKKEKDQHRDIIPHFSYKSFCEAVFEELSNDDKKMLFSKVYRWGGCDIQWYYKTLNRRKIPKIKIIYIFGGYATDLMREIEE